MYLAILCLVILAQVDYSFGVAQCYEMKSARLAAITDSLVNRLVLREMIGGFENVYVPSWLGDSTACSAWFNLDKVTYLENKWLLVNKDKTDQISEVPLKWNEVDYGVIEVTDPEKKQVIKVLYVVYSNRGVVAYITCYSHIDAIQHDYENAVISVKEGLNWDDDDVVEDINAAKAKIDALQCLVSRTKKCQPVNQNKNY